MIILGSFNIIPTAVEFDGLIKCNYSYMIEENTDITLKDSQGSICLDNIWLSEEAKALSTGKINFSINLLLSLSIQIISELFVIDFIAYGYLLVGHGAV